MDSMNGFTALLLQPRSCTHSSRAAFGHVQWANYSQDSVFGIRDSPRDPWSAGCRRPPAGPRCSSAASACASAGCVLRRPGA